MKNNLILLKLGLTIPFVAFFVHLLNAYWVYFEVGTNASANALGLLISGTVALFMFIFVILALQIMVAKLHLSTLTEALVTFFSLALCLILLFGYEIWNLQDYPNPRETTLSGFLTQYFRNLLG